LTLTPIESITCIVLVYKIFSYFWLKPHDIVVTWTHRKHSNNSQPKSLLSDNTLTEESMIDDLPFYIIFRLPILMPPSDLLTNEWFRNPAPKPFFPGCERSRLGWICDDQRKDLPSKGNLIMCAAGCVRVYVYVVPHLVCCSPRHPFSTPFNILPRFLIMLFYDRGSCFWGALWLLNTLSIFFLHLASFQPGRWTAHIFWWPYAHSPNAIRVCQMWALGALRQGVHLRSGQTVTTTSCDPPF